MLHISHVFLGATFAILWSSRREFADQVLLSIVVQYERGLTCFTPLRDIYSRNLHLKISPLHRILPDIQDFQNLIPRLVPCNVEYVISLRHTLLVLPVEMPCTTNTCADNLCVTLDNSIHIVTSLKALPGFRTAKHHQYQNSAFMQNRSCGVPAAVVRAPFSSPQSHILRRYHPESDLLVRLLRDNLHLSHRQFPGVIACHYGNYRLGSLPVTI